MVVLALNKGVAATVADPFHRRPSIVDVIGGSASGADTAARYTPGNRFVIHLDIEDAVDNNAHAVKRLGLGNGAGKAVQNEAVGAVGLREALLDDADDHLVWNEFTGINVFFGFPPHLRAAFQRFTDHIARGDGRNFEGFTDHFSLCALTGARGARAVSDSSEVPSYPGVAQQNDPTGDSHDKAVPPSAVRRLYSRKPL